MITATRAGTVVDISALDGIFRERARDLATLELGPETQAEIDRKLTREVRAERFTRIDRSLIKDSREGILVQNSSAQTNPQMQSHRASRLSKLETMGLAEELRPGVWKIAERTETVLGQLGRRSDIAETMQRALRKAGIDRPISDHSIFATDDPAARITGKIVAIGLSNEMLGHHYVIVDGTDGMERMECCSTPRSEYEAVSIHQAWIW